MKKKKTVIMLLIAALAAGGLFFFFGKEGVYYLHRRQQKLLLELRNDRRIIDSLRNEIKRLTNDTVFIERIAREKLGMARPDERVFKFVEKRK